MRAAVLALLEVSHDAVHDVRLRREQVDGVDIAIRRPPVGDLLDVWLSQAQRRLPGRWRRGRVQRTRDVLVQDGVLVEDVVDEAARVWVDDEHLPLLAALGSGAGGE